MSDLFKKLNTLIKANLNNAVSDALDDVTSRLPRRTPNLDKQVTELRERINAALAYEDALNQRVHELQDEAHKLDDAVEAALKAGDDAQARHLLTQLQRTEQRLSVAEADLRAHQRSAEELIRQVNLLDATIADNKAAARQAPSEATPAPEADSVAADSVAADSVADEASEQAQDDAERTASTLDRLSGALRDAQDRTRARIETLSRMASGGASPAPSAPAQDTPVPGTPAPEDSQSDQPDSAAVTPQGAPPRENASEKPTASSDDDDPMSKRLARLSKPDKTQE